MATPPSPRWARWGSESTTSANPGLRPGLFTFARSAGFCRVPILKDRPGTLAITLSNGNAILVPLSLYPTLAKAKAAERADFRLIGRRRDIHWPALDPDLSIRGLLLAIPERHPASRTRSTSRRPARTPGAGNFKRIFKALEAEQEKRRNL